MIESRKMIIEPNNSIDIPSVAATLPQKADRTMMRTAIILERESKDLAPVAILGVPAAGLLTFYAKNDAFLANSTDKQAVRFLKTACNKTSDIIFDTSKKGFKAACFSVWRGFEWLKVQSKMAFSELKEIFVPQIKRLGRALKDDARSVLRRTI